MKPQMTGTCQAANGLSVSIKEKKKWSGSITEADWGPRCVHWPDGPTALSIHKPKNQQTELFFFAGVQDKK